MWGVTMGSADGLQVAVVPSGAVIIDGWGRSVMMFPTEKEADEYLAELQKEREGQLSGLKKEAGDGDGI